MAPPGRLQYKPAAAARPWRGCNLFPYNNGIKKTIVLVDDEKDLIKLLRRSLERDGFKVLSAPDAESGLKLIRRTRPDLVVLDVAMPGMDGLELLGLLRRDSDVPVIVLSGKGKELDRILGLKLGADDYVVKPFSIGELGARISARLRRQGPAAEAATASAGGLDADFERHSVRVNGKPVRLAPKEFLVLKLLLEANGKVVSRDRLLERIWGHDESMEIDTRTVDQHVARLRSKLGPEAARIVTVPNFGYKLAR